MPVAVAISLVLGGCSQAQLRGYLPGDPGLTNQTDRVTGLWVTSWVILLVVGLITWGLMIWAAVVYRRRKGQTGLPVQLRYNLPIEVFYTIVPLLLVIGFFAFTTRDQLAIEAPFDDPDVQIHAIGKQWSWDFNYVDENVYSTDIQPQFQELEPETPATVDALPALYLPVGQSVSVTVSSRDVAHSFWISDFLYKKDMFPGETGNPNVWHFVPQEIGTYQGKCAEFCGEYHSLMLFEVHVVSQADYDDYIEAQRAAGFVGQLDSDYDRNQNLPAVIPGSDEETE